MTTATTERDTFTLNRPQDVSDGRWHTIQTMAHKMVTGHMPWCEDHRGTEDGDRGWCTKTVWTVAAEVEIHNSTDDGRVLLDLHIHDGIDTGQLTPNTARAIAVAITMAADIASNLTPDPTDGSE